MDKQRLPIALVLSMLFLLWYLGRFAKPPEEQQVPPASSVAAGEVSSGGASQQARDVPRSGQNEPLRDNVGRSRDPAPVMASGAPAQEISFETYDTLGVWQARGASLRRLDLRDYHVTPHDPAPMPLLGEIDGNLGSFLLRDGSGRYGLDQINWNVEQRKNSSGVLEIVFSHETADGYLFRRTVTMFDDPAQPHTFGMVLEVKNVGEARSDPMTLVQQSARGLVDEEAGSAFYGQPTALAVVQRAPHEPEVVKWEGSSLTGDSRRIDEGERVIAAGTITNYFSSMMLPKGETRVGQVVPLAVDDMLKLERHVQAKNPIDERGAERLRMEMRSDTTPGAAVELQLWVPALNSGESEYFDFDVYNGPQALETAALPGYSFLGPVIESAYGNWAWINKTLLQTLRFFHSLIGNWGVAIILLTLLVKTLLFPLNRKQQTSMTRYSTVMAKLKPQLDELKAKYKKNSKKFNEEQMKLLKAEGASPPLGGCLLTFLQFPIWISLFQILGTSIELRQAPFVFWIDDLARPDAMPFGFFGLATINLLPLLMAAATTVQMRFQAKPADAQQAQTQKIMGLIMPIFMLFFLYSYSSGLSLYIFTSSVIGIFEFQVIRRIWPVPGQPGSPAAAKA